MVYLSVVIPAYHEEGAIRAGKLHQVQAWLSQQTYSYEIIVVDDGSQDNTYNLAKSIVNNVLRIQHAGKAAAIIAGIQHACGEIVLFTDMDLATPINETTKLLDALIRADVAIGSRGLIRSGAPPWRYVLSWGQVILRNFLLGFKITDTQCGFKAMKHIVALDVLSHLYLYHPCRMAGVHGPCVTSAFDVELLFVAHRRGYCIQEVPVIWNYQDTKRVKLVNEVWRGVHEILCIYKADKEGRYSSK